ncbi:ASKHA domain-containing protein [Desulfosporosinus sp. SB140]|uniref:ASKHA domain-containing protein n=1 Tax=Desulfosporosinus paludis TaxID=3115649 RepID=UPI00388E0F89
MTDPLVTVTFLPSGERVQVPVGTGLLEAAHQAGLQVNSICGGKGSCGKCRGRLLSGVLRSRSSRTLEKSDAQQTMPEIILLCQSNVFEDASIEVLMPDKSGFEYTPGKGSVLEQELELNPAVNKTFHVLALPSIQDQKADVDRVLEALPGSRELDLEAVAAIPNVLREAEYKVTSVVVNDRLVTVEAGDTAKESYGIAFDIGTTSVAGYLVSLTDGKVIQTASAANSQKTYGADVISRIAYSVEQQDGQARLKHSILKTVDSLIEKLLRESGINRRRIYSLVFIGNTVMSHLLLGVSAVGVASSPFVPAFSRSIEGRTSELGLENLPPYTRFTLLPNVAGYVGSDTVGVMLATKIYNLEGNWLAVDIGTNGEIVLSSGGRLVTCSTAAGPAFEGASISQGMRAEPGAIYWVEFQEDVQLKVVDDAPAQGICGSGLIDCVSEMYRLGMLRFNGRIKGPEECPPQVSVQIRSRIRPDGQGWKFVLAEGETEVALTQRDISELQLGKGAVRAGIEILLEHLRITSHQLDGILLAGAFGSNLRPESIQGIGMFPPLELTKIKAVGNAAGTGAVMALLSREIMQTAQTLPGRVEHIELSLYEGFSRKFAQGIRF